MAPRPASWSRDRLVQWVGLRHDAKKLEGAIDALLRKRGLGPGAFTREDALQLLEELTAEGGATGVAARFAKARLLLVNE